MNNYKLFFLSFFALLIGFIAVDLVSAETGSQAQADPQASEKKDLRKRFRERHFQQADSDKDGRISKEEFLAKAEERFSKKDKNKDGYISKEEMERVNFRKKALVPGSHYDQAGHKEQIHSN